MKKKKTNYEIIRELNIITEMAKFLTYVEDIEDDYQQELQRLNTENDIEKFKNIINDKEI